mgnify:CR=1 FL=1
MEESISDPIENTAGVICTLLFVIFLQEEISWLTWVAIAIITVGIIGVSYTEGSADVNRQKRLGKKLAIIAFAMPFCYAIIEALGSFIVEHYLQKEYVPKSILLSFELDPEEISTLEQFLFEKSNHKVTIKKPLRGTLRDLTSTVTDNATEKVRQLKIQAQKDETVLISLASLLKLESLPERIEAYDISNIGNERTSVGLSTFLCSRFILCICSSDKPFS